MTNPADIARALSEDEKLWLSVMSDLEWMPAYAISHRCGHLSGRGSSGFMTRNENRPNPLIESRSQIGSQSKWYRLTPLGLAVRDYLLHRPTIDASTDRNQAKVVRCGKEIE